MTSMLHRLSVTAARLSRTRTRAVHTGLERHQVLRVDEHNPAVSGTCGGSAWGGVGGARGRRTRRQQRQKWHKSRRDKLTLRARQHTARVPNWCTHAPAHTEVTYRIAIATR